MAKFNIKFIWWVLPICIIGQEACEPGKFASNEIFNLLKKRREVRYTLLKTYLSALFQKGWDL